MTKKIIPVPKTIKKDLTGQTFGRLTVLGFADYTNGAKKKPRWLCQCSCGNTKAIVAESLCQGHTRSCGCLSKDEPWTKHGMVKRPEYGVWVHMIQRCTNPARDAFAGYGGRGVKVCPRWRESFQAFYDDMGPRPGPGYSLDRIDFNGNYEPDNCRWATAAEQANNKSNNRRLAFNGQNLTVAQWAKRLGIPQETLYARLNRGWPIERILTGER